MLEFPEFLSKLEDELEVIAARGRQSPGAFLKDFLPLAASNHCFIGISATQDLYRIEPRADAITFSHMSCATATVDKHSTRCCGFTKFAKEAETIKE